MGKQCIRSLIQVGFFDLLEFGSNKKQFYAVSATIAPSGVGYNENADKRSWKATVELLKEVFA